MKGNIIFNVNNIGTSPLERIKKIHPEVKIVLDFFSKNNWNVFLFDWVDLDLETLNIFSVFDYKNKKVLKNKSLNSLADVLVVRFVGSIESRFDKFKKYLYSLRKFNGVILNDLDAMEYGLTKDYLFMLQDNGFPVIESTYLPNNINIFNFNNLLKNKNKNKYIIKPISGECGNSVTFCSGVDVDFLKSKENKIKGWILQPVIKGVEEGEVSLIFIDGKYSHAIKKIPKQNEIKINSQFAPIYEKYFPDSDELYLSEKILEFWPKKSSIFRFDFIRDNGKLKIMEVETVNPSWYLSKMDKKIQYEILDRFEKLILRKIK